MKKRYGALRVIATVHKVVGGLAGFLGVVSIMMAAGSHDRDAWSIATVGAGGVVAAILLWAVAESILVVIDIEANTRRTADLLEAAKRPEA